MICEYAGFNGYGREEGKRRRAWAAHYMAKGCSSTKADSVAWRKVQHSRTWPPVQR